MLDKVFNRPIESTDMDFRWERLSFGRVREIDLRTWHVPKPLQFAELPVVKRLRKER
jgi:hypothetical protein